MRLIRARNGQSTAEYAILFAIVIGAAIAMQQYVKTRLQGAMQKHANDYFTESEGVAFEPARTVDSRSNQTDGLTMQTARAGNRVLDSVGGSTSVTTK